LTARNHENGTRNRSIQRFLFTPGGGGRRGIASLLEEAVDPDIEDVSRLFSVPVLPWPGIEIEKVCPSFRL